MLSFDMRERETIKLLTEVMAKQKTLLLVPPHGAFQPRDHHTIKKCIYYNKITAETEKIFLH